MLDDLNLIAQVWRFLGHICIYKHGSFMIVILGNLYFFLAVKPHMKTPAYEDTIFVCVDMEIPSQETLLTAREMRRVMIMLWCPVSVCSTEVWRHFQ